MLEIICRCDKCGAGIMVRANSNERLPGKNKILRYAKEKGYLIDGENKRILCTDCNREPRIKYGPGKLYIGDELLGEVTNVKINGG